MRCLVRLLVLLVTLALVLPGWAQDEKKDAKDKSEEKKDAKDKPDENKDSKEMKKDGKDAKKEVKEKPEAKEKLVQTLRVKLVRKPGEAPFITISILVGKDKWHNEEVRLGDDVVVRVGNPPIIFDEKGRLKRYSKKDLEELKGPDKKMPGYTASLDDLKEGQIIDVYLYQKTGGPKNFKGTDIPPEYKPHVNIIVIQAEPRQ